MSALLTNLNPFFAPAEGVVPAGETLPPLPTSPVGTDNAACGSQEFLAPSCDGPVGLSGVPAQDRPLTNSSSCGGVESRHASALCRIPAKIRSGLPRDFPIQPRAGLASGPQDSIPPIGPGSLPTNGPTTAAVATSATADFSKLLAKLNTINHPCDLDALAVNLEKIDRNDPPPNPELLTFLKGEPPISWPPIKPQPKLLRKIFELAGMPT